MLGRGTLQIRKHPKEKNETNEEKKKIDSIMNLSIYGINVQCLWKLCCIEKVTMNMYTILNCL